MSSPRPPRRLMAYYQTFCGLEDIIALHPQPLTDVHLAAIHFGLDADSRPYIHLNNLAPSDPTFDAVWDDLERLKACGVTVRVMIGGAGGGYAALFSPDYYPQYLALLLAFLRQRSAIITGVDLDVEEPVDVGRLQGFIHDIHTSLPSLDFTMAPVQSSLATDAPGMGGFVYKTFLQTPAGERVRRLNAQCYGTPADEAVPPMVANRYLPDALLAGCLAEASETQPDALRRLVQAVPDVGGAYVWELAGALPSPPAWAQAARAALNAVPT